MNFKGKELHVSCDRNKERSEIKGSDCNIVQINSNYILDFIRRPSFRKYVN